MIIDVSLLLLKLLDGCKYKIYSMATSCHVVPFKVKTYMTYVPPVMNQLLNYM